MTAYTPPPPQDASGQILVPLKSFSGIYICSYHDTYMQVQICTSTFVHEITTAICYLLQSRILIIIMWSGTTCHILQTYYSMTFVL